MSMQPLPKPSVVIFTELDNREKGDVDTTFPPLQPAVILLFLRKVPKLGRALAQEVSGASGAQ